MSSCKVSVTVCLLCQLGQVTVPSYAIEHYSSVVMKVDAIKSIDLREIILANLDGLHSSPFWKDRALRTKQRLPEEEVILSLGL